MLCQLDSGVCPHCGRPSPNPDKRVVRECHAWQWGDDLETALEAIGITQEKWMAAKAKLGLMPSCNCTARKEWLNKAGQELQVKTRQLASILRSYYSVPR